jgi:bifunctional non-homologous end joining protein LigD
MLETKVLTKLDEPIRYLPALEGRLADLIVSVRQQRLEGLIAKRLDSTYESGERSGMWLKMRVNQGAGICNWRLYGWAQKLRCTGDRILRAEQFGLRGADAKRFYTGIARAAIRALPRTVYELIARQRLHGGLAISRLC